MGLGLAGSGLTLPLTPTPTLTRTLTLSRYAILVSLTSGFEGTKATIHKSFVVKVSSP